MSNCKITLFSVLAVLLVRRSTGFFTGFGNGLATDTVFDYLGVNSMVPFYTAMFNEMNNFVESGGSQFIGQGTGLLQPDGSVVYPTTASPNAGDGYGNSGSGNNGYSSGMSNNGYSSGGNSYNSRSMFNKGNMMTNRNMNNRMGFNGGGMNFGGGGMFGGGSSGAFGRRRRR